MNFFRMGEGWGDLQARAERLGGVLMFCLLSPSLVSFQLRHFSLCRRAVKPTRTCQAGAA